MNVKQPNLSGDRMADMGGRCGVGILGGAQAQLAEQLRFLSRHRSNEAKHRASVEQQNKGEDDKP